jgi:SAM-dependent methyltransferase
MNNNLNFDDKTIESFGDEWSCFTQSDISKNELAKIFADYFEIFPWNKLNSDSVGFDMGCGSGRWASFVAPLVSHLHCIDPSIAINVAKINLKEFNNITYHFSNLDNTNIKLSSMDFGYSLGVLHHIPDTFEGIKSCSKLLKKGAPILIYLYYNFDNRNLFFKVIWKMSNLLRKIISSLPNKFKIVITDLIAFLVYLPISSLCKILIYFNINVENIPLSYYSNHSIYTMRTDSRDRFGTPLENRFSKVQIFEMMKKAGFDEIKFSNKAPYWCVIGIKK